MAPDTSPTPFLFYGTLMSWDDRGGFLSKDARLGTYGGPGLVRGDLYDVGHFPALRPGSGIVKGQLWTPHPDCVDEATRIFDRIEGFNPVRPDESMYLRRLVRLIEPQVWAYTYVWNSSMIGLALIPGGDWLAYRQAQRSRYEVV